MMQNSIHEQLWPDAKRRVCSGKEPDFTFFTTAREPIERLKSAYVEIESRWLSSHAGPPPKVNTTYCWSMARSDPFRFEAFVDNLAAGRLDGATKDVAHALPPYLIHKPMPMLPNLRVT